MRTKLQQRVIEEDRTQHHAARAARQAAGETAVPAQARQVVVTDYLRLL